MTSLGILSCILFALSITFFQSTYTAQSTDPTTFWDSGGYSSCAVANCFVPVTTSSGCELNDNSCVCTTSSFVTQVATCLGQKCSTDVHTTYISYKGNCAADGGYSLALNMTQFLVDGGGLSSYLSTSFWAAYPECAINACLTPLTAASECEIDDNECVCSNSTLVTEMASCIGKACTSTDTSSVYTQYSGACASNGGYPIALSESQWLSVAGAGTGFGTGSWTVSTLSTTVIKYTSVIPPASSTLSRSKFRSIDLVATTASAPPADYSAAAISTKTVSSPASTTTSTTVTEASGSSTSSTSNTLAPTATNTTSTSSSAPSGGLSNGAIAGITVGGFVVAILALWASWGQIQIGLAQLRHMQGH